MGMSCEEFEKQMSGEQRFYIDRRDDGEFGYVLKDRQTGEIIGYDGGEPEDQLLVRDWQWVAVALNKLADENKALRALERAARARFGEWTRETYVALEQALARLDELRGGK